MFYTKLNSFFLIKVHSKIPGQKQIAILRYVIAFVMVLSCVSTYLLLHLAHCVYSRNLDHQCIVGCGRGVYKEASSPFSLEKHAIGHTSHIMHLIQVVMVGVVSESNFE